eukprot:6517630-Lingulodinium_polyedra.AAC.1
MSSGSWPAVRRARPKEGPAGSAPGHSGAQDAPALMVSYVGTPRPAPLLVWLGALSVGLAPPRTSGA